MKKIIIVVYALQSIITNFVIIAISYPIIVFCLFNFCSGCFFEHQSSTFRNRIDGGIGLILFLGVYILINMLIYKLIAKKLKLKKIYLIIPICSMALSVFLGFWFEIKFP